jgi:hypothetical protein
MLSPDIFEWLNQDPPPIGQRWEITAAIYNGVAETRGLPPGWTGNSFNGDQIWSEHHER